MVGPNDNTLNPQNEDNTPKKSWLEKLVDDAAPVQRDVDTAFTRLNRDGKPAGSFVLALYQLAQKPRELKVQQFEKEFIKLSKEGDSEYQYEHTHLFDVANPILQTLVAKYYPDSKKNVYERLCQVHSELYHESICSAVEIENLFIDLQLGEDPNYVFERSHLINPQYQHHPEMAYMIAKYSKLNEKNIDVEGYLQEVHDSLYPRELCEAHEFIDEYVARMQHLVGQEYELKPQQLRSLKEDAIAKDPVLRSMLAAKGEKDTVGALTLILDTVFDENYERKSIRRDIKKSAFELATLPTHNEDEIRRIFHKEIDWQMREGKIPQKEFKARLPEWLKNLERAGFQYADNGNDRYRSISMTINNSKPKFKEKVLHYFMDKMAYFSTLFAAASAFILTANPWWGLAWGAAVYTTSVNEKAFDAFDYAERLWQDMRWTFSKNTLNAKKLDPKKALQSLLFIGALAAVMVSGTIAAFESTLAAPLVSMLPWFAATTLALTITAWGTINTVLGRSIPHRFVNGLGFHDNAIPLEMIQKAHLQAVPHNDVLKTKLKLAEARKMLLDLQYGYDSSHSASDSASVEFNSSSDNHSSDDVEPVLMQYEKASNDSKEESSNSEFRRSPRLNQ